MKIRGAVLEEIGRTRPYQDSRPITISELELDEPGPGEVLVRIEAAGICHSDLSVRERQPSAAGPHAARARGLRSGRESSAPASTT